MGRYRFVTSTRAIVDSTLTAVLMPFLDNHRLVFNDEPTDVIEFARTKPMVPRQRHWRQPEFCVLPVPPHVHPVPPQPVRVIESRRRRWSFACISYRSLATRDWTRSRARTCNV